jgi:hypothetical protein
LAMQVVAIAARPALAKILQHDCHFLNAADVGYYNSDQ